PGGTKSCPPGPKRPSTGQPTGTWSSSLRADHSTPSASLCSALPHEWGGGVKGPLAGALHGRGEGSCFGRDGGSPAARCFRPYRVGPLLCQMSTPTKRDKQHVWICAGPVRLRTGA